MKNVAFSSVYRPLTTNNFLFKNEKTDLGENLLRPSVELKKHFDSTEINLCTPDTVPLNEISMFVFCETPPNDDEYFRFASTNNVPMILIISESEAIHPLNADRSKHDCFIRIFTYQDKLIDNRKYFKLNYSFIFPNHINRSTTRTKLCTIIASNKTLNHPDELYSERVKAIRWFEKHHPEAFDLYGKGWDQPNYFHGNKFKRAINRSLFLRKLFTTPFPSYKGEVSSKIKTLSNYKFSFCYENTRGVKGYITEKIFDSFTAGCVPIYWGADNVQQHIPPNCFIDKRKFNSYEEIYKYISKMKDDQYLKYLDAIEKYFNSDKAYEFTIDYYIKTLGSTITEIATKR